MEARVLKIEYHKPMVSVEKKNWKEIRKYLKKGFYVSERKDDIFILTKKSKIFVTIECNGEINTVDFKRNLSRHYGSVNSYILANMFEEDIKTDSIMLIMDSEGYYHILVK